MSGLIHICLERREYILSHHRICAKDSLQALLSVSYRHGCTFLGMANSRGLSTETIGLSAQSSSFLWGGTNTLNPKISGVEQQMYLSKTLLN